MLVDAEPPPPIPAAEQRMPARKSTMEHSSTSLALLQLPISDSIRPLAWVWFCPTQPCDVFKEWPRYCRKVYWTKMVQNGQNDHFGQNDWILAFARPKWTKMVHFGPFWPKRSILVHLGPPTVLWPLLSLGGHFQSSLAIVINVTSASVSIHKTGLDFNQSYLKGGWSGPIMGPFHYTTLDPS